MKFFEFEGFVVAAKNLKEAASILYDNYRVQVPSTIDLTELSKSQVIKKVEQVVRERPAEIDSFEKWAKKVANGIVESYEDDQDVVLYNDNLI
jgi:hypothetical protein